jgi:hypothetical protein
LTPDQLKRLEELEASPVPAGTKMLLVEGVHDTHATWKQILGGPTKAAKRAELTLILVRDGGLSDADARALIKGLLDRTDTIKVIFGTDPVRGAYPYRSAAGTPDDAIAHHFDPLYLGGGHKLIANLPTVGPTGKDVHGLVHELFAELKTPDLPTVTPRNTPLQPRDLQAAVPGGAKPAIVYVRDGEVTYEPL